MGRSSSIGRGRVRRRGTSAAAVAGVVGLPDPGAGPRYGDGGLYSFCGEFNRRFDAIAAAHRPEWRSFSRTERQFSRNHIEP